VATLALAGGCGSDDAPSSTPAKGQCSYPDDEQVPATRDVDKPPADPPADEPESVTLTTNAGDPPIALEPAQAPCTVNSFVSLAEQGFFDHTNCHRLTTQGYFVLQCGDPTGGKGGGPGYTFADELVPDDPRLQPCTSQGGQDLCTYNTGIVAMANRGPGTNSSQFFLVYGNSLFPPAYTVFGHLDATGLKTLTDIAAKGIGTPNGMGPGDGEPKEPVTIEKAVVAKPAED
jgi:peptidyl-prolyl cis-trans isomerase B (cyclophilin B)